MSVAPQAPAPSTATVIDGKAIALEIRQEVRAATDRLAARGLRRPGLAVVLVGDNPASQVYVRNKRLACEECGMQNQGTIRSSQRPRAIWSISIVT